MFNQKDIKTNLESEKIFRLKNIPAEDRLNSHHDLFQTALGNFNKIKFLSEKAREILASNEILSFALARKFQNFPRFSEILIEVKFIRKPQIQVR